MANKDSSNIASDRGCVGRWKRWGRRRLDRFEEIGKEDLLVEIANGLLLVAKGKDQRRSAAKGQRPLTTLPNTALLSAPGSTVSFRPLFELTGTEPATM